MSSQNFMLHKDSRAFEAAINHTAQTTAFSENLIEKDYYCSLILYRIASAMISCGLVFKGGTSLSKIHVGFYRLSEDLDFSVHTLDHENRKSRKKKIEPIRTLFDKIQSFETKLKWESLLEGRNESTQYIGSLAYESVYYRQPGRISIEIALREPHQLKSISLPTKTLLLDPIRDLPSEIDFEVPTLQVHEAYAEKVRAALTRKDIAIRDYYDLYYAYQRKVIDFEAHDFRKLVKSKLDAQQVKPRELGDYELKLLRSQLESDLRPVLRESEFNSFRLDEIFEKLRHYLRIINH